MKKTHKRNYYFLEFILERFFMALINEQPLVSVIVPVYNVEQYVERAIESLLKQTYEHIEIIVVDDGSTDRSLDVCQACAERDSRVRIVCQPNLGVSAARNTGLANVTGEFIGFVDADDYVEPTMYEELVQAAINYQADIASCGYFHESAGRVCEGSSQRIFTRSREESLHFVLEGDEFKNTLWNRIYRRSLFAKVVFPVGYNHEDLMWLCYLFTISKCNVFVEKPLYYYTYRLGSIVHPLSFSSKEIISEIHALQARNSMFPPDVSSSLIMDAQTSVLKKCIHFVHHSTLMKQTDENRKYVEECLQILRDAKPSKLPFHYRVKLYFIKHHWKSYAVCYRLFGKIFRRNKEYYGK